MNYEFKGGGLGKINGTRSLIGFRSLVNQSGTEFHGIQRIHLPFIGFISLPIRLAKKLLIFTDVIDTKPYETEHHVPMLFMFKYILVHNKHVKEVPLGRSVRLRFARTSFFIEAFAIRYRGHNFNQKQYRQSFMARRSGALYGEHEAICRSEKVARKSHSFAEHGSRDRKVAIHLPTHENCCSLNRVSITLIDVINRISSIRSSVL